MKHGEEDLSVERRLEEYWEIDAEENFELKV
jgi:hypothetical protein